MHIHPHHALLLLQENRSQIRLPILRILRTKLTSMARSLITIRIMPDDPTTDLTALEENTHSTITAAGGEILQTTTEPVAFGLTSLTIIFSLDATTDPQTIEQQLQDIAHVASATITDIRRALG